MKNLTYSTAKSYLGDRVMHHPVYCGKMLAKPFISQSKALQHAKSIVESIRQDYIERGLRARTIYIDPVNYDLERIDVAQ